MKYYFTCDIGSRNCVFKRVRSSQTKRLTATCCRYFLILLLLKLISGKIKNVQKCFCVTALEYSILRPSSEYFLIVAAAAVGVSADGGQSSQSGSPDDVRRPRLLRVGRHIVVVRIQRVSSDEVRQR